MSDKNITLKIYPDEYGVIAIDLRKYGLETGRDYEVRIRPYRRTRSDEQNGYYRACIVREIAGHTGYTEDETHEILKHLFLSRVATIGDGSVTIAASTTKLTTKEFEEYMAKCRQFASTELGVYIGLPNEYPEHAYAC